MKSGITHALRFYRSRIRKCAKPVTKERAIPRIGEGKNHVSRFTQHAIPNVAVAVASSLCGDSDATGIRQKCYKLNATKR